jgi:hypothetical protein
MPPPAEASFTSRTLPLATYIGRTVVVRLVFSVGFGVTFVPQAANGVGWFIDDLTLTNVQAVSAGDVNRIASGTTFTFTPATAGAVSLQARGLMFGAYPMEWGSVAHANATADPPASGTSYLSNLSVRTNAGTGSQTLIVGFSVSGGTKPLLVRGIGPGLASFGISGALSDPRLELYRGTSKIAENDNWLATDAPTFDLVGAFALAGGSRDSALTIPLVPGSYTAQVAGVSGETGMALFEVYDATTGVTGSKLTNVSARSQVGAGSDTLIAGFNISGTGLRTLLIRAVGPTLGEFGVTGALMDPKLELFGPAGKIHENDNWDAGARSTFSRVGAFDLAPNSRDAVLLVTLPPGSFTAQVSGVGNATGVALIEVYELP